MLETDEHGEVEAFLGRLGVPENRSDPDSRQIEIAFLRLPAKTARPGRPIVYLAGGPGASGIRAGEGARYRLFDALREGADVILLDQRGTGASSRIEPEECDVERTYPLDRPLELDPYLKLVEEVAASCAQLWRRVGVDLDGYTTRESAEDLESLRLALGVDQLDLLAISYGTHLALAYMRAHPSSVGRAVLAGPEGPDHTIKLPAQFDRQIDHLQALAPSPDGGDVRERMDRVLSDLDREPVTLRILEVEGPDRETTLVVGRREVAAVTISMLRDPGSMVQVPDLYERLEAGDFTDIAGALQGLRTIGELEAMPEAMDAASGISADRLAKIREQDSSLLLGSGLILGNLATIRGLGVGDLGDDFRDPLETDVPTLFITGSLDGRTPASNAEELIGGFRDAFHLRLRHSGHGSDLLIGDPRLESAITDFFEGRAPSVGEIPLPAPRADSWRLRRPLTPAEAQRYVGEYERRDREIWRVLHHLTVESLDADGEVRFSNAVLQIRWAGNGFPFHPIDQTLFFIDFPWFSDAEFRFELDSDGGVSHLSFEDSEGTLVRMEKVH